MRASDFSPYHIFIVRIDGQDYKVPHVMTDDEFETVVRLNDGYLPRGIRAFHFTAHAQSGGGVHAGFQCSGHEAIYNRAAAADET